MEGGRERELINNIWRCESAPPSVEGSLRGTLGGNSNEFLSGDGQSHAEGYCRAKVNKHEQIRSGGVPSAFGRIGHRMKSEGEGAAGLWEWSQKGGDGLSGLHGWEIGCGRRRSSGHVNFSRGNLCHPAAVLGNPSNPASSEAFNNSVEALDCAELLFDNLHNNNSSADMQSIGGNSQTATSFQTDGSSASETFASINHTPDFQQVSSSLSSSNTPNCQLVSRTPSPSLLHVDAMEKKSQVDIRDFFLDMNPSRSSTVKATEDNSSGMQGLENHDKQLAYVEKPDSWHSDTVFHSLRLPYPDLDKKSINHGQEDHHVQTGYSTYWDAFLGCPGVPSVNHVNDKSSDVSFTDSTPMRCATDTMLPGLLANQVCTVDLLPLFERAEPEFLMSSNFHSRALNGFSVHNTLDVQSHNRLVGHDAAARLQMSPMDHPFFQNLQPASSCSDSFGRSFLADTYPHSHALRKSQQWLLLPSPPCYSVPLICNFGYGYPGYPSNFLGMQYPGSPLVGSVHTFCSGLESGHSPGGHIMHSSSSLRNLAGGMAALKLKSVGSINDSSGSFLLDVFKSNSTNCLELSDISGHIVELSSDQFGSRFIQQKLETATLEEINLVFDEIVPQALSLMADVFGNYVIQKIFDFGTATQVRELAEQLTGHVLTLSLQMYGCRVIQKAIEIIDLDQQTKLVAELDGHVMRCVHDQNGNHVIQKCIESIPENAIRFIISSFYSEVAMLSAHPYGCRVIQRVLEHCVDPKTLQIVTKEIMECICMLAQDRYGNYVVQHVLEHGKPHERSAIIKQLTGQIVQMSQHKFASNVVEKCLVFGSPEERQILMDEMFSSTDENDHLQTMIKDQFANYVTQKVLDVCDDEQLELILSSIKVHLDALKKYKYGKHMVTRIEKLIASRDGRTACKLQGRS